MVRKIMEYGNELFLFNKIEIIGILNQCLIRKRNFYHYREFIYKFGKEGVTNKQNPVGKNNKNRQSYLDAADSFLEKNKVTCS